MCRRPLPFMERLAFLATKFFAPLVLLVGVAGAVFPPLFLWVLPFIAYLLGLIMFGMGVSLETEDLRRIGRRPWEALLGVAAQYGVMAGVGWLLARGLGLPPELAVGVILVGTCPGGTASNVITFIARGDVALSVSMTAASTLLAPILTPLLTLWLAGATLEVDAAAMFLSILWMVLLPVLLGLGVRLAAGQRAIAAAPAFSLVSIVGILLIVGGVAGASRERLLASGALLFLAVALHNGIGLALGWAIGRLGGFGPRQLRAITLEVGMQNSGMAAALAAKHFTPEAALPAAIFSVWHNITGPALASWWNRNEERRVRIED